MHPDVERERNRGERHPKQGKARTKRTKTKLGSSAYPVSFSCPLDPAENAKHHDNGVVGNHWIGAVMKGTPYPIPKVATTKLQTMERVSAGLERGKP
jgi:hypothetical protein